MTIIALSDRRLGLVARVALTWLMPLCNGTCPSSAVSALLFWCLVVWVGSLLPISCWGTCRFPSQASDHWAVGICLLSKGAGEVALKCLIVICNRCRFPKIAMWIPGNILLSNKACGSRTTTWLNLLLRQLFRISDFWFMIFDRTEELIWNRLGMLQFTIWVREFLSYCFGSEVVFISNITERIVQTEVCPLIMRIFFILCLIHAMVSKPVLYWVPFSKGNVM